MVRTIDFRMDDGLAEKREDGETIHVELEDVKKFYGEVVHYLLCVEGRVQIVEDQEGVVRRRIVIK